MQRKHKGYRAYLLRLWRAGNPSMAGQIDNWRASLESPQTGEQIGLGSLAELFTFLQEEVARCEAEENPPIA